MDSERFDALARRLATEGTSRRRLLRGMGGSLAGAVMAAIGVRAATAAPGGNGACATWCRANFSGGAVGKCVSDAAHGAGPCYGCAGPLGEPCAAIDECHDAICDPSTGTCTNSPKASGASCDGGTCCNGSCCPSSCQCSQGFGGIFCYSGRFANSSPCLSDDDCDVVGASCQDFDSSGFGTCLPINCFNNSDICPTGSVCGNGVHCSELCAAT